MATNRGARPARATILEPQIVALGCASRPEPQTPLANLATLLLRLATVGHVPTLLTVANRSKMVVAKFRPTTCGSGRLAQPSATIYGCGIVAQAQVRLTPKCGSGIMALDQTGPMICASGIVALAGLA
jgi:hypothetical protein